MAGAGIVSVHSAVMHRTLASTLVATVGLLHTASYAQVIQLQNATATFSQTLFGGAPWNASEMINGIESGLDGWAIAQPGQITSPEVAAFETVTNLDADAMRVTIRQNGGTQHLVGRFRISVTADDRALFCDGAQSGGDVTANWTVVAPCVVSLPTGMDAEILTDGSVLTTGGTPNTGTYTVGLVLPFAGITGLRLEVLDDPSLPTGGPGRQPANGNFILSEFIVTLSSTNDTDGDGIIDVCDRCEGFDDLADCNANGLIDGCELPSNGGSGSDINADDVLDDCQCLADLDGDGDTDGSDIAILLGAWGAAAGSAADINADGFVNGADLAFLLGSWGPCAAAADTDRDGVRDIEDNCPTVPNGNQADPDDDHRGSVCDNCPKTFNPNQDDADGDGLGDACDPR
jgi:hypothetical protein